MSDPTRTPLEQLASLGTRCANPETVTNLTSVSKMIGKYAYNKNLYIGIGDPKKTFSKSRTIWLTNY